MALKDVKQYYYNMLSQYIEEKQNLADFEEALKAGQITEEQMQEVLSIVSELENNYHRLSYIMYLFNIPNRDKKSKKFRQANKALEDEFKRLNADFESVYTENGDALAHFKAALSALKNT